MKKRAIIILSISCFLIISIICILYFYNRPKKNEVKFTSCMNIGNALEAPKDIPWDVQINDKYFDDIKDAHFDAVRLPIRFSDYAKDSPKYILDEEFMQKIDHYINYALKRDLKVIIDMHHFEEIMDDPYGYKECFLSMWKQISERYKDYPDELMFEILNEPRDNLNGDIWNTFLNDAIEIVREKNKNRIIIAGPDNYYSADRLNSLVLPKDDNNIIVSFHYYEPNEVTFQGSENHEGFENLKNIEWSGTYDEKREIRNKFYIAQEYGKQNNKKVFLGEFGVNKKAPEETREKWVKEVREQAEKSGFSWAYWELASEFGIYDKEDYSWNQQMLDALLSN